MLETALSDGYLFRGYSLNLLQISIRQGFGDNFFKRAEQLQEISDLYCC
jgi:hypothetical protein